MEKKTKLTISGSAKKSIKNIEIAKTQGKNSVIIEKQTGKFSSRGGSFRPSVNKPRSTSTFNRGSHLKSSFNIIKEPASYFLIATTSVLLSIQYHSLFEDSCPLKTSPKSWEF